jgi:hypothetical protein
LKEALRAFDKKGIISCTDVDALEKELVAFGEAQSQQIDLGNGFTVHILQ